MLSSIQNAVIPVLYYASLFIEEYLEIVWAIEDGKANKIILKGSRMSGKTFFVVLYITLNMMMYSNTSWVVVMENKSDHSDRTMMEFEEAFDRLDDIWAGFTLRWEKKDSQQKKEYIYHRPDGTYGVIRFMSIKDMTKGTMTPPPRNVWAGRWEEEGMGSDQQFGGDLEKIREDYDGFHRFKGGAMRYLKQANRIKPSNGKPAWNKFVEFETLNPYWDENPRLENFNKYHPDNQTLLEIYGYTSHIQEFVEDENGKEIPLKEMYITSNYKVNRYIFDDPIQQEFFDGMKAKNYRKWLIEALGMTGQLQNSAYSEVFHFQEDMNEKYKPRNDFSSFIITTDIGSGSAPTTIGLMGKCSFTGIWMDIEEWGDDQLKQGHTAYDPFNTARALIMKLKEWEEKYPQLGREGYTWNWIIDNDPIFKSLLERAFVQMRENGITTTAQYKPYLFLAKYKEMFDKKNRVKWVKYALTSEKYMIVEANCPNTYRQYKNSPMKNGRLADGDDDYRDKSDMGLVCLMMNGEIITLEDLKDIKREIRASNEELSQLIGFDISRFQEQT